MTTGPGNARFRGWVDNMINKKEQYIYVLQSGDSFHSVEGFMIRTKILGYFTSKAKALKALEQELNWLWSDENTKKVLRYNGCVISCDVWIKALDYFRLPESYRIVKARLNKVNACSKFDFTSRSSSFTLCDLSSIKGTMTEAEYAQLSACRI